MTNLSPPLISRNENNGSEAPLFCCDSFPPGEAKGVLTFSVYALLQGAVETIGLYHPTHCTPSVSFAASSPFRGAEAAAPQREAKSLPYG